MLKLNPKLLTEELEKLKDVYSTEEVKTNEVWIDGKPIYKKVFNLGNLTGSTQLNLDTGLSNIDTLINFNGCCLLENQYGIKLPTNCDTVDGIIFRTRFSNNYSKLVIERTNNSFYKTIFVIKYTKTTDTV